jgi:serine/threonine-protein phosphatase 2B catalytic subunit
VADKVATMLNNIIKKGENMDSGDEKEDGDTAIEVLKEDNMKKFAAMKRKIKVVGRVAKMFETLKSESEALLKLKSMSPDGKIPRGLLLEGRPAIKDAL